MSHYALSGGTAGFSKNLFAVFAQGEDDRNVTSSPIMNNNNITTPRNMNSNIENNEVKHTSDVINSINQTTSTHHNNLVNTIPSSSLTNNNNNTHVGITNNVTTPSITIENNNTRQPTPLHNATHSVISSSTSTSNTDQSLRRVYINPEHQQHSNNNIHSSSNVNHNVTFSSSSQQHHVTNLTISDISGEGLTTINANTNTNEKKNYLPGTNSSSLVNENLSFFQKFRRNWLTWPNRCVTIMNILLILFILQGLFGLFSSFILLYTTGDHVLMNTREYQKLQMKVFINYEISELIETATLMIDHIKYQLKNIPLNLNDRIMWIRLFNYLKIVYGSSIPFRAIFFGRFDDNFIGVQGGTPDFIREIEMINRTTSLLKFYNLPDNEAAINADTFRSSNIFHLEYQTNFFSTSRPWYAPYKSPINPKTSNAWSEVFINVDMQPVVTISLPVYVRPTTASLPSNFSLFPYYEAFGTANNPVITDPEHLYGVVAIPFNLLTLSQNMNNSALNNDVDISFIINSKGLVLSRSSFRKCKRNCTEETSFLINGLKQEITRRGFLKFLNETSLNNTSGDIKVTDFSSFSFNFYGNSLDVALYSITDKYGLDWGVVTGIQSRSFVEEIFSSGVTSVIIFAIVLVLGTAILFLIVQAISIPLRNISKHMVDLVHFKDIHKKELKSYSVFSDIRQMQYSMNSMRRGIKTFCKFVPEIIVKKVISKETSTYGRIGMKTQNLSVYFSDVVGFSLLAETIDTVTFLNVMTEYFTAMSDIIEKHKGLIDKFIGDAIVALFNESSFPVADHEYVVCSTAMESLETLSELNKRWSESRYPQIDINIGINSGQMLCGNIGSESRINFTVIGSHVSLAAKLQNLNKLYKTKVLIGETTYEHVKEQFLCYFVDYIYYNERIHAIYSLECLLTKATPDQRRIQNFLLDIKPRLTNVNYKQTIVEKCDKILELDPNFEIAKVLKAKVDNGLKPPTTVSTNLIDLDDIALRFDFSK